MPHYRSAGLVPHTRHTRVPRPDGAGVFYEELVGEEGFSSDSSLLYHEHIPSALCSARAWEPPGGAVVPNKPLLPRHLRLPALEFPAGTDVVTGRRLVLGNSDVRLSYVVADTASPLYRNAVGDECVFIEAGNGTLTSVFGPLSYSAGDYVVVPRGVTHAWEPAGPTRAYVIEAGGHLGPPATYLSQHGQLLEHAPYCERDLRAPAGPDRIVSGETEVLVRQRDGGTAYVVPQHPYDVVGWDGCLYPWALSVHDFQPITGRVHQPPPVHQVLAGPGFVVCNFVPRKVDYHPDAVPIPYYHANVDSDEVMFYVAGDYSARKGSGIGPGSVSLHPGGHSHGPQPGAVERSAGVTEVDELAVMVDTFAPLGLGEAAVACDDGAYAWSWSR